MFPNLWKLTECRIEVIINCFHLKGVSELNQGKIYLIGLGILLSAQCTAGTLGETGAPTITNSPELSIAGGVNWLHANDTNFTISPYETDKALVHNTSTSSAWKIGVGYHFFNEQLQGRSFFNSFLVELNAYRNAGTIKGNVWQFKLPQFNNYSFKSSVTSYRLMLDAKPGLFTWGSVTPYPILGLGVAFNNSSYKEKITAADIAPGSNLILDNNLSGNFSYDLGAGARAKISPHVALTLEYLYSYLGHATASTSQARSVNFSSVPSFKISSQAVLFGINWII